MEMIERQQLLEKIGRGSSDTLKTVMEEHFPFDVFKIQALSSRHELNNESQEFLKEIYQEVQFAFYKRCQTNLEIKSSLKAYLRGIAHNKLMDYFRKQQRYEKHYTNDIEDIILTVDGPSKLLELKEDIKIVGKCMEELPYLDQQIFKLKVDGDLTHREIAEELNISESKSRKRYERGKAKLRLCIQKKS